MPGLVALETAQLVLEPTQSQMSLEPMQSKTTTQLAFLPGLESHSFVNRTTLHLTYDGSLLDESDLRQALVDLGWTVTRFSLASSSGPGTQVDYAAFGNAPSFLLPVDPSFTQRPADMPPLSSASNDQQITRGAQSIILNVQGMTCQVRPLDCITGAYTHTNSMNTSHV